MLGKVVKTLTKIKFILEGFFQLAIKVFDEQFVSLPEKIGPP